MSGIEEVVLLSEDGMAVIGTAPKADAHHQTTPLHLGFSCYAFRGDGSFLLSQRSWAKRTWPGAWTNSCCGHPMPGENLFHSVERRLHRELGIVARRIDLILPSFRYRAEMSNGIAENEVCPVFRAVTDDDADPHPDGSEVAATLWVRWETFIADVAASQIEVSPWCQAQLASLAAVGPDPMAWPARPAQALPLAARNG